MNVLIQIGSAAFVTQIYNQINGTDSLSTFSSKNNTINNVRLVIYAALENDCLALQTELIQL